jgi:hypothetical protein
MDDAETTRLKKSSGVITGRAQAVKSAGSYTILPENKNSGLFYIIYPFL